MRTTTWALAALLALAGGVSAQDDPPACVGLALTGESDDSPAPPAPRITPAEGAAGTPVRIEGEGFPPGTGVMLVAIYAENDCTIVGLGDEMLGATRVDPDGIYRMERPWPATFTPLLGRGSFPPTALPDGRYFVAALPCTQPAECSLTESSAPGGPFRQNLARGDESGPGARPADGGIPVAGLAGAGAGAFVILIGLVLLRRSIR